MSEYTLYIVTVLLVAASVATSKMTVDTPDAPSAQSAAVIQQAGSDRPYAD